MKRTKVNQSVLNPKRGICKQCIQKIWSLTSSIVCLIKKLGFHTEGDRRSSNADILFSACCPVSLWRYTNSPSGSGRATRQHQHENDLPPRRSCKIRKGNREEVAGMITRRKARPLSWNGGTWWWTMTMAFVVILVRICQRPYKTLMCLLGNMAKTFHPRNVDLPKSWVCS
jgi:hypothetical protein